MATTFTLKLSHRSPKQRIKKLPTSIDVPDDATVDDVKRLVALKAGVRDPYRVGLFDPITKKTLKDRKARIRDIPAVADGGEVLVKDLGLQVPWRMVFVIEYLGPLLFHPLALVLRPYLLPNAPPLSNTQWLTGAMIMAHFVKRELETLFVHKFSNATMPVWNVVRNSFFYWAMIGLLSSIFVYLPGTWAAEADDFSLLNIVGTLLYLYGEISNLIVHINLANLRPAGSTERKIPTGYGTSFVTCPNYMFEMISWLGVILVSRSWTVVFFIFWGFLYMRSWAIGKEKSLRQQFGDRYKKKRYVMIPGLV